MNRTLVFPIDKTRNMQKVVIDWRTKRDARVVDLPYGLGCFCYSGRESVPGGFYTRGGALVYLHSSRGPSSFPVTPGPVWAASLNLGIKLTKKERGAVAKFIENHRPERAVAA